MLSLHLVHLQALFSSCGCVVCIILIITHTENRWGPKQRDTKGKTGPTAAFTQTDPMQGSFMFNLHNNP